MIRSNGDGSFTTVPDEVGRGLAGYDLKSPKDRAVVLDFNGDGKEPRQTTIEPSQSLADCHSEARGY